MPAGERSSAEVTSSEVAVATPEATAVVTSEATTAVASSETTASIPSGTQCRSARQRERDDGSHGEA